MKPIKCAPAILALGLFFVASAARADWQPVKRLTWTSGNSWLPRIAVDSSGHLHLVWYTSESGDNNIYYKKSTNGGTSWSARARLSYSSGLSLEPDLAVDSSDALHVVWYDNGPGNYEIYHKKSTDGGDSWSASHRISWADDISRYPVLAVDPLSRLHVVWEGNKPGNFDIYHKMSTDGGDTWSAGKRLTWTSGESHFLAVAADSSNGLHLAWYDDTTGEIRIYYKRSTDVGATWTTAQGLAWRTASPTRPDLVAGPSGSIHLVGCDNTPGNNEVFYKKSTNGGITWPINRRLTWDADISHPPAIALDSSANLHVVWTDFTPGNEEIYYKKSTDGGLNWTANRRLTWTSGGSMLPDITVDSSGVCHVVWVDTLPGNYEVYYKRGN
jgi:hypothetical protein